MKIKRIISSALLVVMIFTAVIAVLPMSAGAAQSSKHESTASLSPADAKNLINSIFAEYRYDTAEEMFLHEKESGYLDGINSDDGKYSIYVNKYTGVLYYINNVTGQILTSNPYYFADSHSETINKELLSQISVSFSTIATGDSYTYNSTEWAAQRAQISTSFISGGIRVNYTLGDTTARFLLPGRIKAVKFEELILRPMIEDFKSMMEEYCPDTDVEYDVFKNADYNVEDKEDYNNDIIFYGYINSRVLKKYLEAMKKIYADAYNKNSVEYKALEELNKDIIRLTVAYALKNPAEFKPGTKQYDAMIKDFYTKTDATSNLEIYETLEPIYVYSGSQVTEAKRQAALVFQKYARGYTLPEMFQDEKECGYVDNSEQKPVFRCALEYTFNDDGSLSVRLPANSITFDETVYTLSGITPLKYFGAGDMKEDGYIFYPDGSGTIAEYEDFYNDSDKVRVYLSGSTYGYDYCYSKLTGAHRERITMPVYGVITDDDANASTKLTYAVDSVTNGYFAILEEGSSLAKIGYETGGAQHQYASAFCSFNPFPSDQYDLSETISVSGATEYTIVSESRYSGSYVTRYVMLTDEAIGNKIGGTYYPSSYVGMSQYYRNYLQSTGVLSALDFVSEDLPLYVEVLGSMEIIAKVLSFPVTKKIALTTFDDIITMYEQLSDSAAVFEKKAAEYEAKAAEETDEALKIQYQETAAGYKALIEKVETIDNINFRLTGFGNGGLYNTYPTKVRWDRACGGKRDFKNLVSVANDISSKSGKVFGIYPDYDFMYISYTEMFDGVTIRNNVSKMVDNRYASKQLYDSISMDYVSYFTLVVNPESLDKFYSKFVSKYSKYDINTLSVSTLGSDLNSNFDEDQPVNRDEAEGYVTSVLERMVKENGFELMVDSGNIYSVKYATHILNASIDSSHFSYSSYAIPFVGMVLHGSVNYTGTPLNYSGTPAYDMLRSIESGSSLYYILCYQNSEYMKEDALLNDYYGIDYATWFENIVLTYKELNSAIGSLQNYYITDHKIIKGERIIEASEMEENYVLLLEEFIENLDKYVNSSVDAGYKELQAAGVAGINLSVSFDKDALIAIAAEILDVEVDYAKNIEIGDNKIKFETAIEDLIGKYVAEYPAVNADDYIVTIDTNEYESKYSFITDSLATDGDNYKFTDYTSDIGNIVLVTYTGPNGEKVQFVLNYNIYSVDVKISDTKTVTLGKYGYEIIKE